MEFKRLLEVILKKLEWVYYRKGIVWLNYIDRS